MANAESAGRDRPASPVDGSVPTPHKAGPGAGGHRPQHISAVAHLFFQDRKAAAERPSGPNDRDFVVASPGFSAVAAFAAAGLASASGSRGSGAQGFQDVILQEDMARIFSASSYLEPTTLEELPTAGNARSWRIVPGGSGQGNGGSAVWRHLGPLGTAALARMSLLVTDRSLADLKLGGRDGLVWCLLESEAASLQGAMLLGSLAGLLEPARVEILVFRGFPTGPPGFSRRLAAAKGQGAAPRCLEIARRACGDIPLAATLVDLDEVAAEPTTSRETPPLTAVRERLCGSLRPGGDPV